MDNHPIENLMKSTMENLKGMIDVNTIVGDPVETKDGSFIVPISRVSFGFASGGSEFSQCLTKDDQKYPFGGGSGAGITLKPVAFLVMKNNTVRLLPLESHSSYDRIIDTVPQVIDMFKEYMSKDCESKIEKNSPYCSNEEE
ncbi:GerW family sporulation protein [Clostridium malenominatum]|uniref:GerW family sporulation protein n=1 Tax=Clostridium malenominatum TaxID=1539 RepID=A0ABP3U3L1_9CLOT